MSYGGLESVRAPEYVLVPPECQSNRKPPGEGPLWKRTYQWMAGKTHISSPDYRPGSSFLNTNELTFTRH